MGKHATISEVEEALALSYIFRYNSIKDKPEFKSVSSNKDFEPVSNYHLNTFRRELSLIHVDTSSDNIAKVLESSFTEKVNPIQRYFKDLEEYNPKTEPSYIEELCNTVDIGLDYGVKNNFKEYFTKWLVGVVANALDDNFCRNHVCLVLTGDQGAFKTTWLNNLCPPKLKAQYLFSGKINPENKDTQLYLAECFLINIDDQLRQLNKRDYNDLKELITKDKVTIRKPYGRYIEEKPHIASFMASVNGNDFLTDPTGSRRFLPFEVKAIDIDKAQELNMDNVYREANHLLKQKFEYWFTKEEIEKQHEYNQKFSVISTEEEHLTTYFAVKPSASGMGYGKLTFLKNADLQKLIMQYTNYRCSSKLLGEALKKCGFERKQKRIGDKKVWGYYLYERDFSNNMLDIEDNQPEPLMSEIEN